MELNSEKFGESVSIVVSERNKQGTLGAWLAYRNSVLGQVLDTNIVSETNFLTQDKAVNSLSEKDKQIFTKVMHLYRWLHQSSLWQEGVEDRYVIKDQGGLKILRDGALENVPEVLPIEIKKSSVETKEEGAAYADKIDIGVEELSPEPELQDKQSLPVINKEAVDTTTEMPLPMADKSAFIHTIPQTIKSPKPALIFNIEDEKEVDKHREKAGTPPVLEHVLRAFVDEIIATKNLVFRDEVNQRRFIQLMVSRLKDVRGPLEIAEVLRKPAEAGGLGMTEEKADQVQGIMEEAKREFEIRVKNQSLKIPEPIAERPAQPAPVKVEPAKPSYDAAAAKAWRDQMLREIQAQGQPATIVEGSQPAVPKPQLADVKAPPKVVGPLDELRGLNLVDFRRLGSTAQEALQKVKGKIDLLGEMSVTRRVEAVRAWKSSLVYQQYLQLGRESIEQGKPISLVVSNHQTLGDQVLTEDEFTAIADFNAKLRF